LIDHWIGIVENIRLSAYQVGNSALNRVELIAFEFTLKTNFGHNPKANPSPGIAIAFCQTIVPIQLGG
jgi:hypothetical protein